MSSDVPRRRRSDHILPKADLSDPALHTAKELKRALRILTIATVVIYLFMGGIAIYTYSLSQRNKRALCAIRHNAEDRVNSAQEFLLKHPKGIPGITPDDLRRTIQIYETNARALDDVNCS
jgi:hypothetical protein